MMYYMGDRKKLEKGLVRVGEKFLMVGMEGETEGRNDLTVPSYSFSQIFKKMQYTERM